MYPLIERLPDNLEFYFHKLAPYCSSRPEGKPLSNTGEVDSTFIDGEEQRDKHGSGSIRKDIVWISNEVNDLIVLKRVKNTLCFQCECLRMKIFMFENVKKISTAITDR